MSFPASWSVTEMSELFTKIVDGSHNPPPAASDGVPMLSARNVENDKLTYEDFRFISPGAFAEE